MSDDSFEEVILSEQSLQFDTAPEKKIYKLKIILDSDTRKRRFTLEKGRKLPHREIIEGFKKFRNTQNI